MSTTFPIYSILSQGARPGNLMVSVKRQDGKIVTRHLVAFRGRNPDDAVPNLHHAAEVKVKHLASRIKECETALSRLRSLDTQEKVIKVLTEWGVKFDPKKVERAKGDLTSRLVRERANLSHQASIAQESLRLLQLHHPLIVTYRLGGRPCESSSTS